MSARELHDFIAKARHDDSESLLLLKHGATESTSHTMRKRRAFDPAASEFRVRRLALDLAAEEVAREMQITTSKYFRLEKFPLRARHGLVLELDATLKRIEQRTASASRA